MIINMIIKPYQYDNQTFGINQSIITSNCQERCRCVFHNGVTITTCELVCKSETDLKCDPHSQVIKEYQTILNDTSCTCTGKKCVAGLLLLLCEKDFSKKLLKAGGATM